MQFLPGKEAESRCCTSYLISISIKSYLLTDISVVERRKNSPTSCQPASLPNTDYISPQAIMCSVSNPWWGMYMASEAEKVISNAL
jgi:hypothetical protein